MAGLFYFLPDLYPKDFVERGRLLPQLLAERGVTALADCPLADHCTLIPLPGRGPGGKCGTIIYPTPISGQLPERCGYAPEFQSWRPAFRDTGWEDRLWIGFDNSDRPTPDDLRRRSGVHPGYERELGDGQTWIIPVIRRPISGETRLPCDVELSATGKLAVWSVVAEFRDIWERMEFYCQALYENRQVDVAAGIAFAIDVLAVNYRLGPAENNALHVIGRTHWDTVIQCGMDWPFLLAQVQEVEQKKSERPGASTTPGPTADSQTTDLVAAS